MKSIYIRLVTLTTLSIVCLYVYGFNNASAWLLYGLVFGSMLYGVFYFLVMSQHMEDAKIGGLLRKHKKDAHETRSGHLVITDRQITD